MVDRWIVKDGANDGVGEPDSEVDVIKLNAYHVVLPACTFLLAVIVPIWV